MLACLALELPELRRLRRGHRAVVLSEKTFYLAQEILSETPVLDALVESGLYLVELLSTLARSLADDFLQNGLFGVLEELHLLFGEL